MFDTYKTDTIQMTEEDDELARRRYARYIELTKDNDSIPFDEALSLLPMDGGTPLTCGCTRFQHVVSEWCPTKAHRVNTNGAPKSTRATCGYPLEGVRASEATCGRVPGHTGLHRSAVSLEKNYLAKKARRAKKSASRSSREDVATV